MIIFDEPMDAYHAHVAISNSKLKLFRKSPLLYKRVYLDKAAPRLATAAMNEGAAFDCMIFEGMAAFAARYAVKPEFYTDEKTGESKKWNGNANACKAWQAEQEANGRTLLAVDAHDRFALMMDAVKRHPIAAALLSQGLAQVSFRVDSEKFGLSLQCRPDWFSQQPIDTTVTISDGSQVSVTSNGLPYLVDLKKTANFDEWWSPLDVGNPRMGKPIWTYDVDRQAALAQWIIFQDLKQTAQFTLVVEDCEPYRVAIIQLSEDWLDAAWSDVQQDLVRLSACRTAGRWPGSPERVLTMTPPQWLLDRAARTAGVTP